MSADQIVVTITVVLVVVCIVAWWWALDELAKGFERRRKKRGA